MNLYLGLFYLYVLFIRTIFVFIYLFT